MNSKTKRAGMAARFLLTILLVGAPVSGVPGQDPGTPVGPPASGEPTPRGTGRTIGELLEASESSRTGTVRDAEGGETSGASTLSLLLRLTGWTLVVVAVAAGVLVLLRRYTPVGRALDGGGAMRILGRTALSPRHSIVLVRVGHQRVIAVGVSGDRMTTLTEITEPSGILALDTTFRDSLDEQSRQLEHGEELYDTLPGAQSGGSGRWVSQEIHRLRGLVASWRGRVAGLEEPAPSRDAGTGEKSEEPAEPEVAETAGGRT